MSKLHLFTMITMMVFASMTFAQNGKAITTKTTFSRTTSVSIDIKADPVIIWQLLNTAENYPKWNSTIISIEGLIIKGEKIRLISKLDSTRIFKLKIKEAEHEKRLVWGDGKGERVFTLVSYGSGITTFVMHEKIGGCMFPMYAKYIPSFDQSFEQFAADLKKEGERLMVVK